MTLSKTIAALLLTLPFLLALSTGQPAPDFTAHNQKGETVHLDSLKGQYVLLYFYPKDETSGCTQEACAFRDAYTAIRKLNTVVLGVSRQDEQSHKSFAEHHHLPFDLIADPDGKIEKAYDVGHIPILGLSHRKSFLIGPDGKILKVYDDVNPSEHASQIQGDIQADLHSRQKDTPGHG